MENEPQELSSDVSRSSTHRCLLLLFRLTIQVSPYGWEPDPRPLLYPAGRPLKPPNPPRFSLLMSGGEQVQACRKRIVCSIQITNDVPMSFAFVPRTERPVLRACHRPAPAIQSSADL